MKQWMAYCRGCGKLIVWTKMKSGKPMPCDPEVIQFVNGADGKHGIETFITPDGETKRGYRNRQQPGKSENQLIGYVPHWATCPARNQFKRA